ncbi:MAG: Rieske (2Fe-2S) protein [Thaumarchaeota archaeon]|nr:Rieske (2Fe-2S) protein [Nitrososphaerota archaeon]
MNRREFLRSFIVTAALVATAAAGLVELDGLLQRNQTSPVTTLQTQKLPTTQLVSGTTTQLVNTSSTTVLSTQQGSTTVAVPSGYVFIQALSSLSGKTFAYFSHPTFGSSIFVSVGGQWKAFSSTCTHRPCTVQYPGSSIYCPCHDGTFNPADGSVTGGPPPTPLPEYSVLIQNGNVYVGNTVIN